MSFHLYVSCQFSLALFFSAYLFCPILVVFLGACLFSDEKENNTMWISVDEEELGERKP